MKLRFCMHSAKAYLFRVYFLYRKRIQEFPRETENLLKNSGKMSSEYHRFLPAGCITYGVNPLLCKLSYRAATHVERRGKPSTWLPRRKLAEERIPAPRRERLIIEQLPRRFLLDFRIFFFQDFQKYFKSRWLCSTRNNSANSLCVKPRFCMRSAKA